MSRRRKRFAAPLREYQVYPAGGGGSSEGDIGVEGVDSAARGKPRR
jgi:hypothetical protein